MFHRLWIWHETGQGHFCKMLTGIFAYIAENSRYLYSKQILEKNVLYYIRYCFFHGLNFRHCASFLKGTPVDKFGNSSLRFPQQAVSGFHRTQTEESRASWCESTRRCWEQRNTSSNCCAGPAGHETWNELKRHEIMVCAGPQQWSRQKHHFQEGLG